MVLVAARKDQLQRSNVIQPSIDAQRPRWVARENETTLKELCRGLGRMDGTPSELWNLLGRFPRAGALRQPWAEGFEIPLGFSGGAIRAGRML